MNCGRQHKMFRRHAYETRFLSIKAHPVPCTMRKMAAEGSRGKTAYPSYILGDGASSVKSRIKRPGLSGDILSRNRESYQTTAIQFNCASSLVPRQPASRSSRQPLRSPAEKIGKGRLTVYRQPQLSLLLLQLRLCCFWSVPRWLLAACSGLPAAYGEVLRGLPAASGGLLGSCLLLVGGCLLFWWAPGELLGTHLS